MKPIDPNESTACLAQLDQYRAQAESALNDIIQGYRDTVALAGEDRAYATAVAAFVNEVDPNDLLPDDMSNALTFAAELLALAIQRLNKGGAQ